MTMHPNKHDLADLVNNRSRSVYVSGLDMQGQDPTEVDKSERKVLDDPTALYDLGVPNASPPQ
ncbi:hypothetical protein E5161_09830 [Cohnella pontilimi]|uniref:Uncharacterized protein n=1 Tax=Cohnella pontilimi TaxID=2564100 RepID=A0A4V5LSA8_9BACL|nr:hypothetical protein [Cohnella pontilimi]TJY42289.1 hypothetical protein E5161_09830 [Cohnella pontilimi]